MMYNMKCSIKVKKDSKMHQSTQLCKTQPSESPVTSPKSEVSIHKEEFYIQISPRLETSSLTFTNQVRKLKIIEQPEEVEPSKVKSHSQPSKDKIKKIMAQLKVEQPKSHFYNDMKCSRRLKTENNE